MGSPTMMNKKRLRFVLIFTIFVFSVVVLSLFLTQIVNSAELQKKALGQWTRNTVIEAARGKILDAEGNVLAQSATAYKVSLVPKSVKKDERERVATELSALLEEKYPKLTYDYIYERILRENVSEIQLVRQIDRETADAVTNLKLGQGVVVAVDTRRYYPNNELLSQVLGYTAADGNGQDGLELKYDKYLSGENGRLMTERDNRGNTLAFGDQEYIAPKDGCDIVLTVNINAQAFLENALNEALEVNSALRAEGIIMNAKTGAIVAMATAPGYDPNDPPRNDLDLLASLSRNRIVTDAYEPGSTFKIITLASALDSGSIDESYTAVCPGYRIVNGERIKCWRPQGHGLQNLTQCAENSCNNAFMDIALRMGTETFYDYIYAFGFGSEPGSGLAGETSGIVTNEKYIRETDLARIGFGQSIAMSPIQLVTAVSAAVNGGELMRPYIIDRMIGTDGQEIQKTEPTVVRRVISESTSAKVRTILESVVENGSGRNAAIAGYRIGGKTGTAQKYEDGKVSSGKLIASFIGIAPIDDPEFVCLILVDEPKVGTIFGSTVAAPFVKNVLSDVLRYYGYRPEGSEETVKVPNVQGMTIAEAKRKLEEMGLSCTYQDSQQDTVTAQVPQAGEDAVKGSGVLLYTENTGTVTEHDTVVMIDLTGMTRLEAYDALKEIGLTLVVDEEKNTGKTATSQSVQMGRSVEVGTEIKVGFTGN